MIFTVAHALAPQRAPGEDRLAIHELAGGGLVAVVADGAGGLAGGAVAAGALLAQVAQALVRPGFEPFEPEAWCRLLRQADRLIEQDITAGETTAVVVALSAQGLAGASAGDSEAWLAHGADLDELTEQQGRRRLGSGRAAPVGFRRALREGTLLLGSDGLFKYAPAAALCAVASDGDASLAAERLIDRVRLPSGALQDDVAAVLVRVRGATG